MDGFDEREMESGEAREVSVGAALGAAVRDPVVVILVLAGIFDGISGNPVHSVLLFAVAAALGWDAARPRPAAPPLLPERWEAGRQFMLAGTAAALVYGAVVGGFPRYSWGATVAVLLPGGLALALAWRGPLRARAVPGKFSPVGALAWLGLFVTLALWELTQLLLQPNLTTDSYSHPTISVLTDPALASHPGRSIALFVWLCAGGWLMLR